MIENEEGFLRESRRDWEKLGGEGAVRVVGGMGCEPHGQGWELWEGWERWEGWDNPRLTYSAIAYNPEGEERGNSPRPPEGGLAGKGVRAARAGMGVVGGTRRGE